MEFINIRRTHIITLLILAVISVLAFVKIIISNIIFLKSIPHFILIITIFLYILFDFFSKSLYYLGFFSLSHLLFLILLMLYNPVIAIIGFIISTILRELFKYNEEKALLHKFLSFFQDFLFSISIIYLFNFLYPTFKISKTFIKVKPTFLIFISLTIIIFIIIRFTIFEILYSTIESSLKREFYDNFKKDVILIAGLFLTSYLPYYSLHYKNILFLIFSISIIILIYIFYYINSSYSNITEIEVSNVLLNKFKEKDKKIKQLKEHLQSVSKEKEHFKYMISILWKYSKNVRKHININELALDIIAILKETLDFNSCIIFHLNEENQKYYPLEYISPYKSKVESLEISLNRINIISKAITKQSSIYMDIYSTERVPPLFSEEKSIIVVPILGTDRAIGAIYIGHKDFQYYTKNDLKLLQLIAYIAGPNFVYSSLYKKAKNLAITDGLTGLYTHRYMHEVLQKEVKRAKTLLESISIIMVDTDHFKQFNDTYGHPKGDELLIKISQIFKEETTKKDIICRYGGDEFTLVLIGKGKTKAREIAERIRQRVYQELNTPDMQFKISTSIGIASFPEDAINKEELLKKADLALYYSKEHGRNQVTVYSEKLSK